MEHQGTIENRTPVEQWNTPKQWRNNRTPETPRGPWNTNRTPQNNKNIQNSVFKRNLNLTLIHLTLSVQDLNIFYWLV